MQPDHAKVKAAAARIDMRGMTKAALELIAMGGAPIHIRPTLTAETKIKLPPVDAKRRKPFRPNGRISPRTSFLSLQNRH